MPPAELFDGGGGNRTLVRVSFQNHPYVRRRIFLRRSEPAMHRPSRTLSPEISQLPSELRQPPARIFFQWRRPRRAPFTGGALSEREAQLTQPSPIQSWQLVLSRRFYQEPGPGHAAIPSSNPSKPVAPEGTTKYNRLVPTESGRARFHPISARALGLHQRRIRLGGQVIRGCGWCPACAATPKLALSGQDRPCQSQGAVPSLIRIRSATLAPYTSDAPGSQTANSSPPIRAAVSPPRICRAPAARSAPARRPRRGGPGCRSAV